MIRVKICGVTNLANALQVAGMGADLLGLNFYRKSPRFVDVETAQLICDGLRAELGSECPVLVGVFVNATVGQISEITNQAGLDFAQLSGDESDVMLNELRGIAFKALRPPNLDLALADVDYYRASMPSSERVPSLVLDAYHPDLYGGTGQEASIDVALAVKERVPRMMLAGGLNPDNVAERVAAIQPWGVDVASGVEAETPGIKDIAKVKAFIQATRGAVV